MPEDTKKIPGVPLELLKWLEATFPDRSPSPEDSNATIRYKSGQVSVVRKLRQIANKNEEMNGG